MLRFTRATMLLAGVLPNPNCGAVGMPKYPGERARERGGGERLEVRTDVPRAAAACKSFLSADFYQLIWGGGERERGNSAARYNTPHPRSL